ncbi:hypothetical protein Tco_0153128 [Tanacetum coccineum]
MALSIADQIALDDALVAPADRLKIGKCNLRLSSDVTSKEATLQVVYDVLKLTPFYKAFQVTADAPEIYMQEFWASAYVHNRSVQFKMNNKKHIIGLEQFRDILQICPRVGNKKFVEPPLEKEILIFLASLGHSGDIRKITDVNVNKLHQPWRSFAANVDYAYLLWEDFIFKIETKNTKKGSAMYYPQFTKIVINYVMEKDPSIPKRNKVNWHYAGDDPMFTTINVISRNETTQLYGAILPVQKEARRKLIRCIPKLTPPTAPKEKKSGKGKQKTAELETISEADLTEAEQLKIITKRSRQETHSSHASGSGADEGTGVTPGVPMLQIHAQRIDISWISNDDDHDGDEKVQDDDEQVVDKTVQEDDDEEQTESDDDDDSSISTSNDEDSDNEDEGTNVEGAKSDEEATYEEDQGNEEFKDTNTDVNGRPSGAILHDKSNESTTVNQQFLDSIDDGSEENLKEQVKKESEFSKIIPKVEKFVTDQLESEVLVRSSKEANTSHAVAANLSELELKKILIDKMEANNSINRSDIQRQLYKALVEAYEADKILLDTYGDTVTIKRPRDGADDDQEPSAGTDRGSKRRRSGKEPASTSAPSETTTKTAGKTTSTGSKTHKKSASQSAPVGEAMQSTDVFEGPADQEFETGVQDEQAEEEVQHLPDWFQQPTRLPSPDHAWNKSVPAVHESVQPWLSNLAQQDPRESFDELTDSTFDFSAFVLNRLNVQTLTPELLAGPTFELMKGTCKSLTELEYFCEEVYKATTEKLDWINPEGRQYPHDLRQPLPLVPNSQGRRVIPFHHFINNDLEYLRGGVSSRKYSTSVTKTTAADYGHIKWIEDLVPNSMWSQTIVKYDKFALWGISHWGKKRRQFYAFATLRESARDVYSKRRIAVTKVEIVYMRHDLIQHLD